jgi:predicted CxxxxCH...CXXCH cytochrome family protein
MIKEFAAGMGAVLLMGFFGGAGCTESLADGVPDDATSSCDDCHRSADNPVPVLFGDQETETDIAISSSNTMHQLHQQAHLGCDPCHLVPAEKDLASHIDGMPAEVNLTEWGALAGLSLNPIWNPDTKTCQGTYCHSYPGSNGTKPIVAWTDPVPPGGPLCTDCHGAAGNPPQTGAHVIHDQWGVACADCHIVPATADQAGHVDMYPAEVVFAPGSWGAAGGNVPFYDPSTKTCSGTYCHGGPLSGGNKSTLRWTDPVVGAMCSDCHGITVSLRTGAHARHSENEIPCTTCHILPTSVDAPGHIDRNPADILFSPEAFTALSVPSYNPSTKQCTGSYCHGATLFGGVNSSPIWQTPVDTAASCDSCHGAPPPDENHTANIPVNFCYVCHAETVNTDGTIKEADGYHRNGTVEYVLSTTITIK